MPYVALASRLVAAGHDATLVTHASFAGAVPDLVRFSPVESDPAGLLTGPAGAAVRGRNPLALDRARHHFAAFVDSFAVPTREVLQHADVLVASTFALAAVDEAVRAGVPVIRSHHWPEGPDLDGPMPTIPYAWKIPSGLRRHLHAGVRRLEPCLGGFDGWWESGRLHVVPHRRVGLTTSTLGTLHAFSPLLDSAAVAPDPRVRVTGWWRQGVERALTPSTRRLLDSGDRWVYIGFGSMPQQNPSGLLDTIAQACRRVGVRALVQLRGAPTSPDGPVVGIGEEPHTPLFARVEAVVHHGGSGTTGSSTHAGVPTIVVPHFADQFYWGHRLHELGVAPAPLPRRSLSARRLAARLEDATAPAMRARARRLAEAERAEDGTGQAVAHIERLMARRGVDPTRSTA